MKTKHKRTTKDCLIITPLSIDDCLSRIEAMGNRELEVTIKYVSSYIADVQLIERHKVDLAIYTRVHLIAKDENLTCVTFERIYKRHEQVPNQVTIAAVSVLEKFDKSSIWIALFFWIVTLVVNPQATPVLLVVTLIVLSIQSMRYVPKLPSSQVLHHERDSHLKEQQRTEELRADLYHTLKVNLTKTKIDELGDTYYVETDEHQKGYET